MSAKIGGKRKTTRKTEGAGWSCTGKECVNVSVPKPVSVKKFALPEFLAYTLNIKTVKEKMKLYGEQMKNIVQSDNTDRGKLILLEKLRQEYIAYMNFIMYNFIIYVEKDRAGTLEAIGSRSDGSFEKTYNEHIFGPFHDELFRIMKSYGVKHVNLNPEPIDFPEGKEGGKIRKKRTTKK